MRLSLGFLSSHGGSNVQAVLNAIREGRLDAEARVIISNNVTSTALQRAASAGVPGFHLSSATHPQFEELDRAIRDVLAQHGVELVVLAGYMKKIGPLTLERFRGRILNIHPALLPRHGGQGLFGRKVHEAVLAAGERVTGVTIHVIDEHYDTGPRLAQKEVPVEPNDTVDTLAARVLEEEHRFLVEVLSRIGSGHLRLPA